MSDINSVTLIGNVGNDPEYKYFDSGACITSFSIAVSRYDSKKKEDITDWLNVKTFSKLGEYVKKGLKVAINGKIQTDTWETEAGDKRKSVYIFADSLQILTPKEKTDDKNIVEFKEIDKEDLPF
jgi:single-strand DNA-binding protein